jgi:hypothetical protein
VRFWNIDRSEAIVIRVGEEPRAITTQPWTDLDDWDQPVTWSNGDSNVSFRSGPTLRLPWFTCSPDGNYFCYYDTSDLENDGHINIQIAAVDEPDRTLVTSKLNGKLECLYVSGDTLLLIVRVDAGAVLNELVCEKYLRKDGHLAFAERLRLQCPDTLGVNFVPRDFDPETQELLLSVDRDMPVGGTRWFVYDCKKNEYRTLGRLEGFVGFLDRNVFDRAIEIAATLKCARKRSTPD